MRVVRPRLGAAIWPVDGYGQEAPTDQQIATAVAEARAMQAERMIRLQLAAVFGGGALVLAAWALTRVIKEAP